MDIEIIDYMKVTFSPEMAESFEKSFELFNRFNLEDYILPFDSIYMEVDNFDTTYIQQRFIETMENTIRDLLNNHGIFVSDDATHDTLNAILEAILDIEYYEDIDMVLSIMDSEVSDEEKFSEVLALLSTVEQEEYMNAIERVNPGLIRTITTLFNGRKQAAEILQTPESVTIKAKAEWVKRLFSLTSTEFRDCKLSILFPKLEEGLRFNMEFDFYYNLLWGDVSHLTNADIARDLIGMAIVSSNKSEQVLETIKEYVGKYFSDIDQIGRILDLVTRQFLVSKQDNGVTTVQSVGV